MNSAMMSVNSLNIKIKSLLEATFMHIKVQGEIASVTYHQASGHVYFSIKDDKSSLKCVMFRSNAQRLRFQLQKGMKVVVEGSVGVYTPRGEYQFYAVHIEPSGVGALALAYQQLKEKLHAKGYFAQENKKSIPQNIQKLALVTAKNSAALHDMITVIEKRFPLIEVTIIDTLVQGNLASNQIAQALYYADTINADVIVVGRGGGSAEDLWAFNEEVVADAIFALRTPVVSAVGHEIDTLISDFVADLRAPTPSAAIEMILPDKKEILYALGELESRYASQIKNILYLKNQVLQQNNLSLRRFSIKNRLEEASVTFDRISDEYKRVMRYKMTHFTTQPPILQRDFKQFIETSLKQKTMKQNTLLEQYTRSNPRNQLKDGWAKVSMDNKSTNLQLIMLNDTFILEDTNTKIKAVCLNKSTI